MNGNPSWAKLVLAPNPGPMTLDGTNTWLLGSPDALTVVDPGPLEESHLMAIVNSGDVSSIVLSHGHSDHSAGVDRLHALTGAPVFAYAPEWSRITDAVNDGDVLANDTVRIEVLHTPGHTSDSISLLATSGGESVLVTGDTILGRGTAVIMSPDGRLKDYFATLDRIAALPADVVVLPGHGPAGDTAVQKASEYLVHRRERLAQVEAAVTAGAATADDVVDAVYGDVTDAVKWAAKLSVQAQLDYIDGG